jgi:signal transduction histidine kinase
VTRRRPRIPQTSDPFGRVAVAVFSVLGTLLLCVGAVIELMDAEPRAQLWVAAAAGMAFLVAVAFSDGTDVGALTARTRLLVGAGLCGLLLVLGLWQVTASAGPHVLLLVAPVGLLFATMAVALRAASASGRRARLREVRSRLDGEEAERRRWVRELHDDTLQDLAAVDVLLGSAAASGDAAIVEARSVVGHQIRTLRHLMSRMRPLALDTLGLAAALEDLARRTEDSTGIEVRAVIADLPRLASRVETDTYRVVQEALSNATRHSGGHVVTVEAGCRGRWLELTVRDDGRGLPENGAFTPGYGVLGMRERAETLGAGLTVTSPAGGGTLVRLRVPLGVSRDAARP